jgi:hypothetical protein
MLNWLCCASVPALLLMAGPALAQGPPDSASAIPKPLLDLYAKAVIEHWVWFGGGLHQNYWFRPGTAHRTKAGTTILWTVFVQEGDSTGDWSSGREAVIAERSKNHHSIEGYETYLMTTVQWEVDCSNHKERILQLLDYNCASHGFPRHPALR